MDVRRGGPAGFTHLGDFLAGADGVAGFDEQFAVVRVTRDVTIAVVDLQQVAVALPGSGPGDRAAGHRQHFSTLGAGEIQPFVLGLLAGERVVALAKTRGNPAFLDRPARGCPFLFQVAVEQQQLQGIETGELAAHDIRQAGDGLANVRNTGMAVLDGHFRAAHGRRLAEIEFFRIQVAELHEPFAEGVETGRGGLQFRQPGGQRVDVGLVLERQLLEQLFLLEDLELELGLGLLDQDGGRRRPAADDEHGQADEDRYDDDCAPGLVPLQ